MITIPCDTYVVFQHFALMNYACQSRISMAYNAGLVYVEPNNEQALFQEYGFFSYEALNFYECFFSSGKDSKLFVDS